MARTEVVEEVIALLRDSKPAEWGKFRAMDGEDYERILANWTRVLAPVADAVLLQVAVIAARKGGAFLPSPGDLYELALDLLDDAPDPDEAWAVALEYARTPYIYKPEFKLPERVRLALKGMGDPGQWEVAKYGFRRSQFRESYERETERWRALKMLGSGCSQIVI